MKPLTRIETRKLKHYFTQEEKAEFSAEAMQIKNDIEAKKKEAASVSAVFKAEIGTMEAKEKLLRTKYTEGFENREEYVFVKKDYEARKVYFISRETGAILDVENFTPRDEVKQLDINAEELKASTAEQTFVDKANGFFYALLVEMESNKDNSVPRETVNLDKWRFISLFVNYCEKNSLLDISSPVSFDEAFDTVQPLFEAWLESTYPAATEEETVEEGPVEPVFVVVSYGGRLARFEDLAPETTLVELAEFTAEFFGMTNEEIEGFGFIVVSEIDGKLSYEWVDTLQKTISEFQKNELDVVALTFAPDAPTQLKLETVEPTESEPLEGSEPKIKPLLDSLPQTDLTEQIPADYQGWAAKGAPFDELLPPIETDQQDILKSALEEEKPKKKAKSKKSGSEPTE